MEFVLELEMQITLKSLLNPSLYKNGSPSIVLECYDSNKAHMFQRPTMSDRHPNVIVEVNEQSDEKKTIA